MPRHPRTALPLRRLARFALTAVVGASFATACSAEPTVVTPEVAPTSPLIALTPAEINNSVRDLLGLPMDPDDWPTAPDIGIAAPLGAGGGIFGSKAPEPPAWPYAFPNEARAFGFEGMATGQMPSSYLVEQLQKAARHYAAYVLVSPVFFTCEGATFAKLPDAEQTACADQSLLRFAQRAWRRPLTGVEAERVRALWATMKVLGTPEQAIALSASAVLQAPAFLFRVERGDTSRSQGDAVPLTDWEMASRLSYYLWDSMPDGALFAAAAQGKLRTAAEVEVQARRMLGDPRAQRALLTFHHQWLGTDQLHRVSPARRIYGPLFGIDPVPPLDTTGDGEWPALMNPLRRSLEVETDLFVRDALFGRPGLSETERAAAETAGTLGTLTALMTGEHAYVSEYTAPIYGVGSCDSVAFPGGKTGGKGAGCTLDDKAVDTTRKERTSVAGVAATSTSFSFDLHPATVPKGQRAGVLTLPSVLALGAHAVHPSPILRGLRLLERIACVHFSPPPPTAEESAPKDTPDATSTNRERTVAATDTKACSYCHDTMGMNMAGFAFEHYDSFGHWRDKDAGKPVDAAGSLPLPGSEPVAFTDAVDLAKKLSTHPVVQNCYVRQHARYATGVEVPEDHPALAKLQAAFRKDDRVIELLVAITTSDLFRYRNADAAQGGN